MGPLPKGVFLTKGVGKHREKLNSFELALRSAKRTLQHNIDATDLDEALRNETTGLAFARKSPNDARESLLSFQEKRKGVFTGT